MSTDSAILNEKVTLHHSGLVVPNRFLKSAMTERLCEWSDDPKDFNNLGKPTPEYLELYRVWGQGECGILIMGNVPVDARYPEAKKNAVIDKTQTWNQVEAFKPVIAAAKAGGSIVIAQLTHAGRQTSNAVTMHPVSSSDIQTAPMGGMVFEKPRPMTIEEIEDFVDRMAYAAKVLYDAGADGAQLHAAHGYLLSQFLSPRVNKRTDKYGGDLQGRSRIIFECVEAIRKRVPDLKFFLSIKINSADFSEGGFSAEDSLITILKLEKAGLDLIELSGGSYESRAFQHVKESTRLRESYFIEFADNIRPHLTTAKLAVTGGFRSVKGAAGAIKDKSCDFIGLARPLTAEPSLTKSFLEGSKSKAKENLVPTPLQTGSSVMQLSDIGKGLPIRDLQDQSVADSLVAIMTGGK